MQCLKPKLILLPSLQCSLRSPPWPCLSFKTKTKCFSSLEYRPWSGLQSWRESPVNEDRKWGPNGPQPQPSLLHSQSQPDAYDSHMAAASSASSLAELGALVLSTSDPLMKSRLSHLAYSRWRLENLPLGLAEPPSRPARPIKPDLVRFFLLKSLGNIIFMAFSLLGFFHFFWETRKIIVRE